MPLYEYKCEKCGKKVEILQRVSDPPYSHCPKCGGDMKKLHSSPAIQFKGSGFYKTDYPSKSSGAPETKTESKSETKTESKSETKSDSSGSKD